MTGPRVELDGADRVERAFAKLADSTASVEEPSRALVDVGLDAARSRAPVRTGNLVASIQGMADATGASLSADTPYAPFIEYGTDRFPGEHYMAAGLAAMAERAPDVYRDWLARDIRDMA